MTKRIDVSICTYMRQALLRQCLESLLIVEHLSEVDLSVTVIDNDTNGSAKPVVDAVGRDSPFPIDYVLEKKRGIPCARNRALDEAESKNVDYLVFIDDDEWVESTWLSRLYASCVRHGGDVIVSGEVVSELPEGVPLHISGLFNKKKKYRSGAKVDSCATNNVLVPMSVVRKHRLRFDEKKPLAGGTDTIFFKEATMSGVSIIKEPDAIVHELVPESRLSLRWFVKRKYRAGITDAWRKRRSGVSRVRILMSALFQIVFGAIKAVLFVLLIRRLDVNKSILRVVRAAGVMSGILGVSVDSYQRIDSAD